MAELSEEEKNEVSHRGNALRKVLDFLSNNKKTEIL
jgi:inosine/xanthosine triphosphate pyrophosphatase family protein